MKLYIDIEGTLLGSTAGDGPFGYALKEHVDEFIKWATTNFDCYWLTGWAPDGQTILITQNLLPYLPEEAEHITVAEWSNLKTEALIDDDWIWIDDKLLPAEERLLKERNLLGHFIMVDVTEPSMKHVMSRIEQARRQI